MKKWLFELSLLWSAMFSPRCIHRWTDNFDEPHFTIGFMHKGEFHGEETFDG
jgi:hypothetical protein